MQTSRRKVGDASITSSRVTVGTWDSATALPEVSRSGDIQTVSHFSRERVLQKGKQIHGIAFLPPPWPQSVFRNRRRGGAVPYVAHTAKVTRDEHAIQGRTKSHTFSFTPSAHTAASSWLLSLPKIRHIFDSFPCCACIQHGVGRPQDRSRSKFTHPWSKMRRLPRTNANGHALADPAPHLDTESMTKASRTINAATDD